MPRLQGASNTVTTPIIDIGLVGVQMQATAGVANMIENIHRMRASAVQNIYLNMQQLAKEMEEDAQALAHRLYRSHYDRHPSAEYPNEDVAADSIEAKAFIDGDQVGILLQYPPETVMITHEGRRVTYGGILEAEYHGDFAVIQPTWNDSFSRIGTVLAGTLTYRANAQPARGSRKTGQRPRRRVSRY